MDKRKFIILSSGGRAAQNILYSLRDDFLSALAAGSVDGTSANPGPGTRKVIDTENKLSITTDGLIFSGGKATPAFGNPGFWLDAESRVPGKVAAFSIQTSLVNNKEMFFGWTTAQSADNFADVVYFGVSNNLVFYDAGNGYNAVGSWEIGTDYHFWIVLRAAGAFLFASGGIYGSYPILLIAGKAANGATVYPSLNNYNAAYKARTIRVPEDTYLPVPLLSDSFNRADGVVGVSDGTAHAEANGGSGVVWAGAGATIDTNRLKITPTEGDELATGTLVVGAWYKITATESAYFYAGCAVGDTFLATATTELNANNKVKILSNMFALAALSTPDICGDVILPAFQEKTQCGYVLRSDSTTNPQNFVICYRDGSGNIKVAECVNGVYSQLSTVASAFAANETWRVRTIGRFIRLHKNTTLISSVETNVVSGNVHGVFSTNAANRFDTICIFPSGTEGQHSTLQNFLNGITTKTFLAIGDSKTACTSGICWQDDMTDHAQKVDFLELSPRIAGDGWKVASPDMDVYLAQVNGTPDYAFINFGVNDLGITSEASFKASYLNILDKLHTKYPNIICSCARIWKQAVDQGPINTMNTWIDDVISLRSSFAVAGPDERITLEGGDDGATYCADETPRRHPNDAGYKRTAIANRQSLGYS